MGRIVVNKHYSGASSITIDKFANKGEILICNEPGFEGLYILNNLGHIIKVGTQEGSGVPQDIEEFLLEHYFTNTQVTGLVSSLSGNVYNAIQEIADGDDNVQSDWNVTNEDSDAFIKNKPTVYNEEQIKSFAAEEVAKVVAGANSNFDTLKEIADWIASDTTNAAKMAQDILDISAATRSSKSSDHVTLSKSEYEFLEENGYVVVCGETITYDANTYYCIPSEQSGGGEEPDVPIPTGSTDSDVTENGELILTGEISFNESTNELTLSNVEVSNNGILTFLAVEEEAEIDENTNELSVSEENIDNANNTLTFANSSVDENNILTINI